MLTREMIRCYECPACVIDDGKYWCRDFYVQDNWADDELRDIHDIIDDDCPYIDGLDIVFTMWYNMQ